MQHKESESQQDNRNAKRTTGLLSVGTNGPCACTSVDIRERTKTAQKLTKNRKRSAVKSVGTSGINAPCICACISVDLRESTGQGGVNWTGPITHRPLRRGCRVFARDSPAGRHRLFCIWMSEYCLQVGPALFQCAQSEFRLDSKSLTNPYKLISFLCNANLPT